MTAIFLVQISMYSTSILAAIRVDSKQNFLPIPDMLRLKMFSMHTNSQNPKYGVHFNNKDDSIHKSEALE